MLGIPELKRLAAGESVTVHMRGEAELELKLSVIAQGELTRKFDGPLNQLEAELRRVDVRTK